MSNGDGRGNVQTALAALVAKYTQPATPNTAHRVLMVAVAALAVGGIIFAVYLLAKTGAFDYGTEKARASVFSAVLTLIAATSSGALAGLGLLHSRNVERRQTNESERNFLLALELDARNRDENQQRIALESDAASRAKLEHERLAVETAAKLIGLIDSTADGTNGPSARADGAVAALVALGQPKLATSLTSALWKRGVVSPEAAMVVADGVLYSKAQQNYDVQVAQMEISSCMHHMATSLANKELWAERDDESWRCSWPYTVRHNLLSTVATMLGSTAPGWKSLGWYVSYLAKVLVAEKAADGADSMHLHQAASTLLARIRPAIDDADLDCVLLSQKATVRAFYEKCEPKLFERNEIAALLPSAWPKRQPSDGTHEKP